MTTYLLHDDALRSPEMRHEIGEAIMDSVTFLEHDGKRIVAGSMLEQSIFEKREDVVDEFWNVHDLGFDELLADPSFTDVDYLGAELVLRTLKRAGVGKVVVPGTFSLLIADYLRAAGIEMVVDAKAWQMRRRRKSPAELEGVERAQRATETAMLTASRMLREAEPTKEGLLRFEGEILTAELIREAMQAELLSQGAESEGILVQSGDACLSGHEIGSGPILPDQSCIVDCFPKDRRSGAFSDMTRTFVPGEPSEKLVELHKHCLSALEIAYEAIRPGRKDAHAKVAEYFHSHGFPTRDHHPVDEQLTEGFFHSLGHGVGLEVHEKPWIGRKPDEFVDGDVVAVEPGLYFAGVGGVRVEDTVLVADDGIQHFTDPFPYDLTP
jgi:Xaa-Pro aminopeptidase